MTALIKVPLTLGLTLLSIASAFAQNRVEVNQSDGASGNRAVVSQSGSGNRVVINQSGSTTGDSSGQPGNHRRNLRVDSTAQTTINQQGPGPNRIELMQDGQTTTIISQSSERHSNTVTVLPGQENAPPRLRSTKRRNRR